MKPTRNSIINPGAVIAVLLGVWCVPIGIYGFVGAITGQKIVAGLMATVWAYMAVVGTYELIRRKFNRDRGRRYADWHLLAGSIAVSEGLMISGAIGETMPALAIVPALSAIVQASDGHTGKVLSWLHAAVLAAGIGVGIWFYRDGVIGGAILARIATMP